MRTDAEFREWFRNGELEGIVVELWVQRDQMGRGPRSDSENFVDLCLEPQCEFGFHGSSAEHRTLGADDFISDRQCNRTKVDNFDTQWPT